MRSEPERLLALQGNVTNQRKIHQTEAERQLGHRAWFHRRIRFSGLISYRINVRPTKQEAGDDTQGCI